MINVSIQLIDQSGTGLHKRYSRNSNEKEAMMPNNSSVRQIPYPEDKQILPFTINISL
jgi:hypothetical protein